MRIAVYGAGAVGGYFGGRLADAGNDVWFIARGRNLQALRAQGLRITSTKGDLSLPVQATDDPGAVGTVDLVLVCVKSWQLQGVTEGVAALVGPQTLVIPLLNGVEAADELAAALGWDRVLKGMCRIIAFLAEPGHVQHAGIEPTLLIGERSNRRSDRIQSVIETLVAAGIEAQVPPDIDVAIWQKLAFVGSVGGVCALTRAPIGAARSNPSTRRMIEAAVGEVAAVGRARGVAIPADVVDVTMTFIDTLPEGASTSLQRDIESGRPSELDAWNGAVVRLAAGVGVPVPTHSVVYASLGLLEQRARGQRSFDTPGQDDSFRERFLTNIADQFRSQRQVAERALEQTSDQAFFEQIGPESNSMAALVKHLAGNHRSRWTDFLTTDGEKPDRHRDTEFEVEGASRQTLMAGWDSSWTTLLDTVDGLTPNDLDTVVEIRGQPHKVEAALTRSLVHSAGHVGQLVLLAKHLRGLDWRTLSIPLGGTESFNRQMRPKFGTKS